jgi:hypothetical protein
MYRDPSVPLPLLTRFPDNASRFTVPGSDVSSTCAARWTPADQRPLSGPERSVYSTSWLLV